MSEPGREITDLEMMADSSRWPYENLLPMVRKREDHGRDSGLLVTGPLGRYIWYEGVDISKPAHENEKYMKDPRVMLAPGLADLIEEGWQVD